MVDLTDYGEITVDYQVGSSADFILPHSNLAILGTGTLQTSAYPTVLREQHAARLWHPMYLQANGESIQLHMYLHDGQMGDLNIRQADFQMHGMLFEAAPTSQRLE